MYMCRFERALPIYARRTDILEALSSNRICVVVGETGSGKSTQLVQYAHAAGFGTIVCTQPRKVAALSLSKRVASEMGDKTGLVGTRVGAQSRTRHTAKLLFMTDHILLSDCLRDPLFSKYSLIFVDEAHERSIFTDLLLGFLKKALAERLNCLNEECYYYYYYYNRFTALWFSFGTNWVSWHQKGKTRKVKPTWIYWSKR